MVDGEFGCLNVLFFVAWTVFFIGIFCYCVVVCLSALISVVCTGPIEGVP